MIYIIPGILLTASIIIHSRSLILLAKTKNNKYLKIFFITAILNIILSIVISLLIIHTKNLGIKIDYTIIKFIFSGVVFIVTLGMKILIIVRIYKRAQQPEHFHLNFFGKKVLHSSVVKSSELMIFFVAIPFFLLSGSYFLAKLIDQFN